MEDDITNTFTCDTEKTRALSVPYITFCQNILLVEPGYKRVLIDSGVGQGDSDDAGHFLDRLPAENIKPESIDTVMISHYHPDHAGNPTFPKRASLCQARRTCTVCVKMFSLVSIDRYCDQGVLPARAKSDDRLLMIYHFPFPGLGYVRHRCYLPASAASLFSCQWQPKFI
jgi:ribonuclease BN (tRNA processing enzyme)